MRDALERLGLICRVAVGLVGALLLLNVLLQLSTWAAPTWLSYRLAGTGFQQDIDQRVEAAEAAYRDASVTADRALCVLIGLSGLREAADLKTMSHADGSRCRYLGLSGAGGSIDTLLEQNRRLLEGSLRPDVAVIGLSAYLLVKPLAPQQGGAGAATSRWSDAVRHADARQLARAARDWMWFITRRRDVNGAIESFLLQAKQAMLRALGAARAETQNPMTDPWREMIRLELPEHPSEAALREEIAGYGARRLYEPQSYAPPRIQRQVDALVELIGRLRQRGAVVIVVTMPEHSRLRAQLPPEAMQALRSALDRSFGHDSPPVVDLRAAIPDSGFTNISHVNAEGRAMVSSLLAAEVAGVLRPGRSKPLMSQSPPAR